MIEPSRPLLPDILRLHGKWRATKLALVDADGSTTWAASLPLPDAPLMASSLPASRLAIGSAW